MTSELCRSNRALVIISNNPRVDVKLPRASGHAHVQEKHMRTWRFVDEDHLTQDWRIEGSPKGNSTVHLDFVRKD